MTEVSWYYSVNLKPQGPVTTSEMREKIVRGEVGPHDLICQAAGADWKPAVEWGVFEVSLFPATQGVVAAGAALLDEKEWVLLVSSEDGKAPLQEGPFSVVELRNRLQQRTVSGHQYVWKTGLSGWCRLRDRPEFSNLC